MRLSPTCRHITLRDHDDDSDRASPYMPRHSISAMVLTFMHQAHVMVAPITSTIRGAPSEVVQGEREGLKLQSAVNLDHVQTDEQARLTRYVGTLSPQRMQTVRRALLANAA